MLPHGPNLLNVNRGPRQTKAARARAERLNSVCRWQSWPYPARVGVDLALKTVTEAVTGPMQLECRLDDGSTLHLPAFLGKFIRRADVVRALAPGKDDLLVERSCSRSSGSLLRTALAGYATRAQLIAIDALS